MIHYPTPYSTDKNIGRAYNDAISAIQGNINDWVVLRDGDTAFLTPEWGRQIEEVAESTDYTLLGCMTNRLRYKHQLYKGKFDSKCDMYKNFNTARKSEIEHWAEVVPTPGIAGLFMMFQIKTWAEVGGFKENTI